MRLAFLLLGVLLPSILFAGFVSMEEGARATAMGGAFTGVSDDATAVFWNPAGCPLVDGLEITGMRTRAFGIGNLSEDCISIVKGSWRRLGFGFGWNRAAIEDIYSEDCFVLSAGRRSWRGLSLGASVKIFKISAPGYEYYNDPGFKDGDHGFGFDLGLLYKARNWSLGCVFRNLGKPELSMIATTTDPDRVPMEFRLGGTYTFREVVLLSGEMRRLSEAPGYLDSKFSYHLGTEIWFFNAFSLRAGINGDHATAGVGLKVERLSVDASILSERRPGNKYRLSITFD